jgi:RNA polymerase sigma factor (sigma-70 family)
MFMPCPRPKQRNQPETASRDWENRKELFNFLRPRIPLVVEQVCARINPRQAADREDFVETIDLMLRENEYAILDSFQGQSDPTTWLFSIARNYILDQLRKQRRMTSLGDLSPDALVARPDQERSVFAGELVRMARSRLTPSEKRLFNLWLLGWSNTEMADALGIQVTSVENKKSRMFKKIRDMAGGGGSRIKR